MASSPITWSLAPASSLTAGRATTESNNSATSTTGTASGPRWLEGTIPHELLPAVHRVASLVKRWLLGTHQGSVGDAHLPGYLNEFVFRFNPPPLPQPRARVLSGAAVGRDPCAGPLPGPGRPHAPSGPSRLRRRLPADTRRAWSAHPQIALGELWIWVTPVKWIPPIPAYPGTLRPPSPRRRIISAMIRPAGLSRMRGPHVANKKRSGITPGSISLATSRRGND